MNPPAFWWVDYLSWLINAATNIPPAPCWGCI